MENAEVQRESTAKPEKLARWGQDRRLEFIDFRLLWDGRINRADLTSFFGISVPQASLDLTRYQELAPKNVEYDRREKVYLATKDFSPILTAGESRHYLNQLLAVNSEMMSREMSFLGWYPDFDCVLSPVRKIAPPILSRVLRAIRTNSQIEIEYQSFSSAIASRRTISPHAIAYDGFRWHTRAYCHRRMAFRDFVFARILEVFQEQPSDVDSLLDAKWHKILKLVLAPHPGLSEAQRRTIELDYAMVGGQTVLECRHALLFYAMQRLRLDETINRTPQAQQITLVNREELNAFLGRDDQ
jgi:hypothetical protein